MTVQACDYRIEVYISVEAHEVRSHYGELVAAVKGGSWCVRYGINSEDAGGDSTFHLFTHALRQALEDPAVLQLIGSAEKYTASVVHKNSGPSWTIVVDNSW